MFTNWKNIVKCIVLLSLIFACRTAPEAIDKDIQVASTPDETIPAENGELEIDELENGESEIDEPEIGEYEIGEYEIPESIMLCGETIDLTKRKNYEMFDREFTISVWDRAQIFMWLKRTGKFFPYFERRLKEAGLPEDLKYLAVAESSLHTHIRSKAGALGIWQFMKPTAKRYGLRVERGIIDERLCYERSTDVAIIYLKELKEKFESWKLAMAAYNCGENRVNEAVKNQNENYVNLYLPRETERYVFRIAAIKYIMETPAKFGYMIKPKRLYKPIVAEKIEVNIKDRINISDLVKEAEITYKKFRRLNPQILSSRLPKGQYQLNIPPGYSEKFTLALKNFKNPSKRKVEQSYTVQPGDALYNISWETGISVRTIKKLNQLKNSRIYPGQRLILKR